MTPDATASRMAVWVRSLVIAVTPAETVALFAIVVAVWLSALAILVNSSRKVGLTFYLRQNVEQT
jgi:hypothetical protein